MNSSDKFWTITFYLYNFNIKIIKERIKETKALINAANAIDSVSQTVIKNQSFQINGLLNFININTRNVPIKIAIVM